MFTINNVINISASFLNIGFSETVSWCRIS